MIPSTRGYMLWSFNSSLKVGGIFHGFLKVDGLEVPLVLFMGIGCCRWKYVQNLERCNSFALWQTMSTEYLMIHKKCHLETYHSDIKHHMALNIIFSVVSGNVTRISLLREMPMQLHHSRWDHYKHTSPIWLSSIKNVTRLHTNLSHR